MAEVGETYIRTGDDFRDNSVLKGDVAIVRLVYKGDVHVLVPRLGRNVWVGAWTLDEKLLWRRLDG